MFLCMKRDQAAQVGTIHQAGIGQPDDLLVLVMDDDRRDALVGTALDQSLALGRPLHTAPKAVGARLHLTHPAHRVRAPTRWRRMIGGMVDVDLEGVGGREGGRDDLGHGRKAVGAARITRLNQTVSRAWQEMNPFRRRRFARIVARERNRNGSHHGGSEAGCVHARQSARFDPAPSAATVCGSDRRSSTR